MVRVMFNCFSGEQVEGHVSHTCSTLDSLNIIHHVCNVYQLAINQLSINKFYVIFFSVSTL